MSSDPDGPPVVSKQLQLQLDGVEPLSAAERLDAWLRDQEEDSADSITASLFLQDRRTRRARSARWRELQVVESPYATDWGSLVSGGEESLWLYREARWAYVEGLHLAALLCAHAACERVLAGCMVFYEDELDKGWRRWGLGPLVQEAFRRGLLDEPLRTSLARVNEIRKVSAHFKPPLHQDSLTARASLRDPDFGAELPIDEVAQQDAALAIKAAAALILGSVGFRRATLLD